MSSKVIKALAKCSGWGDIEQNIGKLINLAYLEAEADSFRAALRVLHDRTGSTCLVWGAVSTPVFVLLAAIFGIRPGIIVKYKQD